MKSAMPSLNIHAGKLKTYRLPVQFPLLDRPSKREPFHLFR